MLKSYKIHQEQIENVARTLKESPQRLCSDPTATGRTGKRKPALNIGITGNAARSSRNVVWETGAVKEPVKDLLTKSSYGTESPGSAGQAPRCIRCGDGFPLTDFLYTKKTGLCISCWEAKVV